MPLPLSPPPLPGGAPACRPLWRGPRHADGAAPSVEVPSRTWTRILDPDSGVMCLVAEPDGRDCGFAHCVVHEATSETQPVCHLEDLYVEPASRRRGVARAMLEWLRNAMRAEGWARLYWLTRHDNAPARALHEQFAQPDEVVRYVIAQPTK